MLEVKKLWPDMLLAQNDPFVGGQFLERHGSTGMQPLGGDGYFRTQAQLRAVGKARAGIDVHCCGIYLAHETTSMLVILG